MANEKLINDICTIQRGMPTTAPTAAQRWTEGMRMAEYKDITELKKQIADFKKAVHSPNGDYLTGYLCALSATEGIIAGLSDADVVPVVR